MKCQKEKGAPRTVVIILLNYRDKVEILKNSRKFKSSGIYENEDFCKKTNIDSKRLVGWRLRNDGKYAVIQYDKLVQ